VSEQYRQDLIALESLVDTYTLTGVICMLSEIAGEKQSHIRANYQDDDLARKWRKAELGLDRLHVNTSI
jgi:hypothetical protein